MTRVTPLPRDLAKLTKTVGTAIAAPRASQVFKNVSWSAAARVRKELEHGLTDVPASERTITTTHRPIPMPTPNPGRTIPLMQAFHTSPTSPAQTDTSTIDYAFLPDLHQPGPARAPLGASIRLPLLPDNFAPQRTPTLFAPELSDEPLREPEIVVVAADPASVSAVSALTEVEGMSPDGVELSFAHDFVGSGSGRDGSGGQDEGYAGGMLTDLWKGLVDDVMGGGGGGGQKIKPAM